MPAKILFHFFLFLLELCNNTTHWKINVLMSPKVTIASYIYIIIITSESNHVMRSLESLVAEQATLYLQCYIADITGPGPSRIFA